MAEHIKIGQSGEKLALTHLLKDGFTHIESNYRAKTGEIDLIVRKESIIHFVEVKSVSREINRRNVPHGTWRPEENVHSWKLRKLINTIQVWISHRKYEGDWQLDVITVVIDVPHGTHKIEIIENIILE
jgi:putative endonuclease